MIGLAASIDAVHQRLKSATTFFDVFGPIPAKDEEAQLRAIGRARATLAKLTHPDYAAEDVQEMAKDTFSALQVFYMSAQHAIRAGRYGERFPAGLPPIKIPAGPPVLVSPNATYTLDGGRGWPGEFSRVYAGEVSRLTNPSLPVGKRVAIKIARLPRQNLILESELLALGQLGLCNPVLEQYLPRLVESFFVDGGKGRRFRANVFIERADVVSVAQILNAFPSLEPIDAGWIARRVFAQVLAAHSNGFVHGSIDPAHVFVNPETREPLHLGWTSAVRTGTTGRFAQGEKSRWEFVRSPEAKRGLGLDVRADIYSAGRTIQLLFAHGYQKGTVPKKLAHVLNTCVFEKVIGRESDPFAAMQALTDAVRSEWGRAYRPLVMPATVHA